jgi:hypothetical protein
MTHWMGFTPKFQIGSFSFAGTCAFIVQHAMLQSAFGVGLLQQ